MALTTTPVTGILPSVRRQIYAKRQKRLEKIRREEQITRKTNFLQALPLELLIEVLSYVSPITLLAVARTSSWLCRTLTKPEAAHIWKTSRRVSGFFCVPDPAPDLRESAYASWIFEDGECESCGQRVKGGAKHVQSRVRVCTKYACKDNQLCQAPGDVPDGVPPHPADSHLIPSLYHAHLQTLTSIRISEYNVGIAAWDRTESDPDARSRLLQLWQSRATLASSRLQAALKIISWEPVYLKKRDDLYRTFMQTTKSISSENGWEIEDLRMSAKFQEITRVCEVELVPLVDEFHHARDTIATEVRILAAKRCQRKAEAERLRRQNMVEGFWRAAHRNGALPTPLPPAKAFRSLPSVHSLEQSPAIDSLAKTKNEGVVDLIRGDLDAHIKTTSKALLKKLGLKPSLETGILNPLERVTSLFECRRCHRSGRLFSERSSLDLNAVVTHRCPKGTRIVSAAGKVRETREWDLANFEVDRTAVAASTLAVQLSGNDESKVSRKELDKLGLAWRCLSCPSGLSLDFASVVGHAKRHKATVAGSASSSEGPPPFTFSLQFLPKGQAAPIHPVPRGFKTIENLMGDKCTSVKARQHAVYGCRHCAFARKDGFDLEKAPKMTIDGMRSHLSIKHGIKPIRGEDFYEVVS